LILARDQANEAMQARSDFLANMSHEIRTPMNAILGMLGILIGSELTKKQQRHVSLARSSAISLLHVINDILDFSKVDAGKLDFEIIDFDLHKHLDNFVKIMSQRADEEGLELILDVTGINNGAVKGDPGRLQQVLSNLVSNALKFTERGEVCIRASLEAVEDDIVIFHCYVIDTGIGIPEDKMDLLFNSFTQVDASTTRKYGGTGLGLAIAYQLCEQMGSEISVTSERGKGSTFEFQARLKRGSLLALENHANKIKDSRILVVDDNSTSRRVFCSQLELWGAVITSCDSGSSALKVLSNHMGPGYSFALIDGDMPDIDGLVLTTAIRSNVCFDEMGIVLMMPLPDHADMSDPEMFSDFNRFTNISKPFSNSELVEAFNRINTTDLQGPQTVSNHFTLAPDAARKNDLPSTVRILLVDDNEINQEVALGMLEELGLTADTAENGRMAIEKIVRFERENPYDIVLMDCQMPEMDGYEATRHIRSADFDVINSGIVIIAMTANAMKGDKEKCINAGMNDYLAKPIDPDLLREKLVSWLDSKKLAEKVDVLQDDDAHASSTKSEDSLDITEKQTGPSVSFVNTPRSDQPEIKLSTPHSDRLVSELEIWDREACYKRMGGKPEKVNRIIGLFLKSMPDLFGALDKVVRDGDAEQAGLIGHEIKGVAGNMCCIQLLETALQIETAGKQGDTERLNVLLPQLDEQQRRLSSTLENEQSKIGQSKQT
jgi:two-component system sensor histidine kinase/response regulator